MKSTIFFKNTTLKLVLAFLFSASNLKFKNLNLRFFFPQVYIFSVTRR